MNRTQFIDYQGKKIFYIDFSNLKTFEEIKALTLEAQKYIHSQPPLSVITLSTVENTHFNTEIKDMFTEYIKSNKPYVKTSAVIGISGLKMIMYNGMMKISGRDTRAFSDMEQAKSFLASAK